MRVHRLEVTAFGPFATTASIDVDALNDAGFFLLTGPTGAGKTSVLDAICFGLYGAVPGVRNNARDLKSHHADPRQAPSVVIEVTLRDRRFRLRRTPAWRRASTRARAGYVDVNASVTAEELVDGSWVPRGNRLDEVGLLVSRTLGMTKEQFCQVVMLPQGQFETFLRAGAKERHDVLEALFQTGRFLRIEQWLADHRRRVEAASDEQRAVIDDLLVRAEEALGEPWCSSDLPVDARIAALRTLLGTLHADVGRRYDAWEHAEAAAKQTDHARSEGERIRQQQERHVEARRALDELDAAAEAMTSVAERVGFARQADRLLPRLALHRQAATRLDQLRRQRERRCRDAVAAAVWRDDRLDTDLESAVAAATERVAALRAALGLDAEVADAEAAVETTSQRLTTARDESAQLGSAAAALPALIVEARRELEVQAEAAGRLELLTHRVASAAATLAAACEVPAARTAVGQAEDEERRAHALQLDARETELGVREARIASMAAHLAADLRPGEACAVCGSDVHPQPADATERHTTDDDERGAALAREAADVAWQLARDDLHQRRATLADLEVRAGGLDEPTAASALRAEQAAHALAQEAAETVPSLAARVAELDGRRAELGDRAGEAERTVTTLETDLHHQVQRVEMLHARRSTLVGPGTILDAVVAADADLQILSRLRDAVVELDAASTAVDERREELEEALAHSPFDDVHAVERAAMTEPEVTNAEALIRQHERDRAVARASLDDPHLVAAAALPTPDVATLRAAADEAALRQQEARDRYRETMHRDERLAEIAEQLASAEAAWAPLRQAADLAAHVATVCAGTSVDNQTRTKLSHYVLAARLQQVVAAANVRLGSIASGRYQLAHTMRKGVGDARGGLGLRVVDGHTGAERDPATLSGGETFYVSLALALGLADLVRDEIGGAELSTLFVDEGFGSLDPDTLDEVLDEIDTLRSGGRSVGLVSHLDELRRRIPTQVRIVPSQRGSTISVD